MKSIAGKYQLALRMLPGLTNSFHVHIDIDENYSYVLSQHFNLHDNMQKLMKQLNIKFVVAE